MPYIYSEDSEQRIMICEHLTEETKPIIDSLCDVCQYHGPGKRLICVYSDVDAEKYILVYFLEEKVNDSNQL